MAENRCILNKKGRDARDELLELAFPKGWTNAQLHKATGIEQRTTVPKILSDGGRTVMVRTLRTFFTVLLEKIAEEYNGRHCNGKIIDQELRKRLKRDFLITHVQLREYLLLHLGRKEAEKKQWRVPDAFWDSPQEEQKTSSQRKATLKSKSSNQPIDAAKLVELFRYLDYKEQQEAFDEALESAKQVAAFSIATPCEETRHWILHRLIHKIPNHREAIKCPIKPVSQHLTRESFDIFWEDLAAYLEQGNQARISPTRDGVLAEFCRSPSPKPVLICIPMCNLGRHYQRVKQLILHEFWQPLAHDLTNRWDIARRTESSRVILFFLEDCSNFVQTDAVDTTESNFSHLLPLSPLEAITQRDIAEWLERDSVREWWSLQLGHDWGDRLQQELALGDWDWHDPGGVINALSSRASLKNGILDLDKEWR